MCECDDRTCSEFSAICELESMMRLLDSGWCAQCIEFMSCYVAILFLWINKINQYLKCMKEIYMNKTIPVHQKIEIAISGFTSSEADRNHGNYALLTKYILEMWHPDRVVRSYTCCGALFIYPTHICSRIKIFVCCCPQWIHVKPNDAICFTLDMNWMCVVCACIGKITNVPWKENSSSIFIRPHLQMTNKVCTKKLFSDPSPFQMMHANHIALSLMPWVNPRPLPIIHREKDDAEYIAQIHWESRRRVGESWPRAAPTTYTTLGRFTIELMAFGQALIFWLIGCDEFAWDYYENGM